MRWPWAQLTLNEPERGGFEIKQDPPGILALIQGFYYAREMPRHCRANLHMSGLERGVRITVRGPVLSPDEGKTRIYFERRSMFSLTPFVWRDAPGSPTTPNTPMTKKDKMEDVRDHVKAARNACYPCPPPHATH